MIVELESKDSFISENFDNIYHGSAASEPGTLDPRNLDHFRIA